MLTAFIDLRKDTHYRTEAFVAGFTKLGFRVVVDRPYEPLGPDDVAVVWNKTARSRQTIEMARKGGGAVIVAENGYYGKDADGLQSYALALDGHCGSGRWFVGGPERLEALNIDFKPYQPRDTNRVLVAAQRGIGSPAMASPFGFALKQAEMLQARGYQPIIREHPGRHEPAIPLAEQLAEVGSVVVWSSNCATSALIEGLPTFYCAPHIVTQGGAVPIKQFAQRPFARTFDLQRREAFVRMSWAQAFLGEISTGEALDRLLQVHAGSLPACQEGLGL